MKKLFTSALLVVAALASPAFASVLRVNNTPGVNAPYSTFAAAQTAAVAGDVIQLEPSNTSYGALTVTKAVTIMGPGYLLGTGQNTGLQYTALEASTGAVNFNAGSSGARITGLRILGDVTVNVSTITVERNIFWSQDYSAGYGVSMVGGAAPGISDVFVRGNIIGTMSGSGVVHNFNIANNIFRGGFSFSLPNTMDGLLTHNIFNYAAPSYYATTTITINNSLVTNNIAYVSYSPPYGQGALGFSGAVANNNTYTNNIGSSTQFPNNGLANINNQQNVTISSVLVMTGSDDAYYALKPSPSPGRGNGTGGADIGIFGGSQPYMLSGIPNSPTIYNLNSNVSGTNLNVTLGTKSNN